MRVLIPGMDGYLGWSLAQYLKARGHEVGGVDIFYRRKWVAEMGSHSATPIVDMPDRLIAFKETWGETPYFRSGDLTDWDFVKEVFEEFKPEAIVHLGECPSAPYSMASVRHATWVQTNNIVGTLNILFAMREFAPQCHLVKLGTMGEYGTPNVDIPEGFFEIEYRGRKDKLPFPRQAGSWYHQSKVHDSNNVMFACKIWGLRSTDIMQGVVYGTRIDEMGDDERLITRLDFDECFGTAINRFACQAVIGEPLTPFGKGHQRRGFIPLRDSMQCLTLAVENPPEAGEYRVFNQFEETYDIYELAEVVLKVANSLGFDAKIQRIENPRQEMEEHYYNPDHQHLLDLGYKPTHDMEAELVVMLKDLMKYKDRILAVKEVLIPEIRWDGTRRKSRYID
jgi:UDP-sulfoquinovose synthase